MPSVIATTQAMRSLLIAATYRGQMRYRYGDSNPGFRTEKKEVAELVHRQPLAQERNHPLLAPGHADLLAAPPLLLFGTVFDTLVITT
jgi:hypothetical protein